MTRFLRAAMLLPFLALSSCYELQSDEELREDIIGTWTSEACEYPHSMNPDEATSESPLRSEMTFYTDGRFTEGGYAAFCTSESCDTIFLANDCRCTWVIAQGELAINSIAIITHPSRLNQSYPIKCLDKDVLVIDNMVINGQTYKKACFQRK